MSRGLRWVAAALLLAAIAGILAVSRQPRPSPEAPVSSGAGFEPEAPPSERSAPRVPSRSETPPNPEGRSAVGIRGRLVVLGGGPVGRARVAVRTGREEVDFPETVALLGGPHAVAQARVHDRDGLEERVRAAGGWKPVHRTEPDADGSFEIAVPADFPEFSFEVEAEFARFTQGGDRHAVRDPEIQSGFVLELEPAGKVEGSIAGPSGPVGGRVSLVRGSERGESVRAESDPSGRFEVWGVAAGRYRGVAAAEGCAPEVREDLEVRSGAVTRIDFSLPRESSLSGRVVGPSNEGVAGARLLAWPEDEPVSSSVDGVGYGVTATKEDGSFRLGSLRGGRHVVAASARGLLRSATKSVEVPTSGSVEDLVFSLGKGRFVAGRVTDSDGKPVEPARVRARRDPDAPRKEVADSPQVASTGLDGAFRLSGLGEGPFLVTAEAPGRKPVEKRRVEPDTEGLALVFGAPTGFAGVVRSAAGGEPIRGFEATLARVSTSLDASGAPLTLRIEGPRRSFETQDGSFEWLDLEAGVVDLRVRAPGFVPEILPEIAVQSGEVRRGLEFRLRPGAAIRGKVLERASGSPIAGAEVGLVPKEAGSDVRVSDPDSSTRSAVDGAFSIDGLGAGFVRLRASHEAFVAEYTDLLEVREGGNLDGLELRLGRGGGVDGHARGPRGEAHEGAQVIVVPPDLTRRKARNGWTDASGYFKVEGLVPGRHHVRVFPRHVEGADEAEEEKGWLFADADVREGEVTRVEFPAQAERGCLVRGRVLRGNTPVEGAQVRLTPLRSLGRAARLAHADRLRDRTRPDGSYRIEGAPPGPASLGAYVTDGEAAVFPWTSSVFRVEVPDAAEVVLDAHLPSGAISGRVVLAGDGRPLPGIVVLAVPFDPEKSRLWSSGAARSGPDGRYRIRDLPAGAWLLRPRIREPDPAAAGVLAALVEEEKGPVEIGEGGNATVDFEISTGGTARVSVRDPAGRPVPRAGVVVFPSGSEPFDATGSLRGVHARTDESGVARVRGLAPGLQIARVLRSAWASGESEPRLVRAGEETEFSIEAKAGTRVRIRLLDDQGEAIGQGRVRIRDREGRTDGVFVGQSDASDPGEEDAAVAVLLPGEYALEISAFGYRTKPATLRVGGSSPQACEFRLERAEPP